ncbi:MAG TPA: hypothetical protein ENK44_03690 [Caldithrix abyssi]|uniref:Zn-dependent metallo-hydrolase RNA specificity domain-containing protein n=1 Tax=Caldithrix abyssi TaxID=187145 RepID=A0A7V4WTZ8_CALAY|nr:hypothetical protein [Caldithrix abyssi]
MFSYEKDILVKELDLWLDSRRVRPFSFASHAHSDHIARHKKILCSPPTADLLHLRLKGVQYQTLSFGRSLPLNGSIVSLHPAGHILGSAQIKIESQRGSLLYTGDFRPGPSRTTEPMEIHTADTLIMETTFGRPHYRMPPRSESEQELLDLCSRLLKQGRTPVIFAYSLGKGQEILKILTDADLPVAVDYQILKYIPVYQKYGVDFGKFRKFRRSDTQPGVILLPTTQRHHRFVQNITGVYTIYVSGWAIDANARYRFNVDEAIPISDHADFNELLHFVEQVRPKEIYCTHGSRDFISVLRNAGFKAYPLEKNIQLQLDL